MIYIANLINGEQIIGNFEESRHNESYKIYDPFYIVEDVNSDGLVGSKLTNVLTFSSEDYIMVQSNKIVFLFEASDAMSAYYEKLSTMYDKKSSEDAIKEALHEIDQAEKRYEKLMSMFKPNKSQLN